jgi:hypothetical protein
MKINRATVKRYLQKKQKIKAESKLKTFGFMFLNYMPQLFLKDLSA